jgi:hypothetical protein
VALVGLGLVFATFAGGFALMAHRVQVGVLDALSLAAKTATPRPSSALDWPELRIDAVLDDPTGGRDVLIVARWPARPDRRSTLVLDIGPGGTRAQRLLATWCEQQVSIAPTRVGAEQIELRRRQSSQRVHAVLLSEDHRRSVR